MANNLALALDQPVQVNAYLTPPGTKGLELHFDYHDVFVLQLDGRKRWRVWEPLPRTRQPVRRGPAVPMPTFDELGEPLFDLTLHAGDCLYLPRGFPHAAETVEAASSHLTIGVMALTWQQAVHRVVDDSPGPLTASITPEPAPSLHTVADALSPARLRRWMATEVWRRQPATRLRPLVAPEVEIDTKVAVTAGPLLWLAAGDDHVQLGLGDRELRFPLEAQPFLAALLSVTGPCTLDELDGPLDAASRLVVGRRLAAEGVVAPVG